MNVDLVAMMCHSLSKDQMLTAYHSLKQYTKKVSKKADLVQQLTYLLYGIELLYNRLLATTDPSVPPVAIDKSKLAMMSHNELLGTHTLFRKCMRYTNTKQAAINNLINVAKQVNYFVSY